MYVYLHPCAMLIINKILHRNSGEVLGGYTRIIDMYYRKTVEIYSCFLTY